MAQVVIPPSASPPEAVDARDIFHRVGMVGAYLYLLRVPLLICLFVAGLPLIAVPRDAAAGSLLRGLFDVAYQSDGQQMPLVWVVWSFTFFLLTLTAMMTAASVAITARLILKDAQARFNVDPLPRSPGIQVLARLLPALSACGLIIGAWIQSFTTVGVTAPLIGIAAGIVVFIYVDGGYYDNYGTATLLQWLAAGLEGADDERPKRILLLEIRSFPDGAPAAANGSRGWTTDLLQPLKTLYEVRGTGQQSHSDLNVQLLHHDYPSDFIDDVHFTFPGDVSDEQDDPSPPLSWHLTPADRQRLADAWNRLPLSPDIDDVRRLEDPRQKVHHFLHLGGGPVSDACLERK